MLKGLSLIELAQKIESQKAQKRDFIVDTADANFFMNVVNDRPVLDFHAPKGERVVAPIMPIAHKQIASRLKIPGDYYDRMLTEQPDLLTTNVNRWFKANPEKRMARTLAGNTRAFLSNRYNRIENEEIAEAALPVLMNIPGVKIVSAEVTDRRMYIQAVSTRVQGEVKRGDIVQAGVVISNSEVGAGAVNVSPMVYRLVCLNGMIRADAAFKAYHVGRNIEDNAELWADDTKKADDRAVLLKVRDMVSAAVDQLRFNETVAKMMELSTEAKITGNPAAAVAVLAQKIDATQAESGGILRALIEGGDLSAWGVINAVTAQAHSALSYDRSVELELAGGQLLELSPSAWREVLEAETVPVRRGRKAMEMAA